MSSVIQFRNYELYDSIPDDFTGVVEAFGLTEEAMIFKHNYVNGLLHSVDDDPSVIEFYGNEFKYKCIKFHFEGKLHRDGDLPAVFEYSCSSRKVVCEKYYKNHKLHRDNDLPAVVKYDTNGNVIEEMYYIDGVRIR